MVGGVFFRLRERQPFDLCGNRGTKQYCCRSWGEDPAFSWLAGQLSRLWQLPSPGRV